MKYSYSDRREKQNNLYDYDPKFFHKIKADPPIFIAEIDQNDYEHLMNDDLDEISKQEVSYKILKNQLREQQKRLIQLKEERQKQIERDKLMKKNQKRLISPVDLSRFARHIKHFELYGSQRDLSPELKRIVKNLMCQEHKFMYCPKCKQYEIEKQVDPVENIQKFMNYIKKEQEKLRRTKKIVSVNAFNNQRKKQRHDLLPDDSASDITNLEEQEILAKYMKNHMTEQERKKKDRREAQKRLYGENYKDPNEQQHKCKNMLKKRSKSGEVIKKLKVELRAVEDPLSMQDESNSAHQFSLHDISVQADSEARRSVQMQTSVIDVKSMVNQTSKQDKNSIVQQTSDIEYRSNNMQTSLFGPNAQRREFSCQTDPKLTQIKLIQKQKQIQTQKYIDLTKEDWVKSSVYKKAMINEAKKRNINFNLLNISNDNFSQKDDDESSTIIQQINQQDKNNQYQYKNFDQQNTQDPDTEITSEIERQQQFQHSGLGFLKNYWEKGNIQILSQTELQYVKQLLKQKNHDLWKEPTMLNDLHRHCKYTIRKLTQQMANLDNTKLFRNLKIPSRKQTLYLVYRAELLFQALQESEKIFNLLSKMIFDRDRFKLIVKNGSTSKEDLKFINHRETLIKRIMTQVNSFIQTYKLFYSFIFKGEPIIEYLQRQIQQVIKQKQKIQELLYSIENELINETEKLTPDITEIQNQQKQDELKSSQKTIMVASKNSIEEEHLGFETYKNEEVKNDSYQSDDMELVKYENQYGLKTLDAGQNQQKITIQGDEIIQKQLSLKMNKYNEQDLVGKETLSIINNQVDQNLQLYHAKSQENIY